jgi:hypothetical protein
MLYTSSNMQDTHEWLKGQLERFNKEAYVDDLALLGVKQVVEEDIENYWQHMLCDTYEQAQAEAEECEHQFVLAVDFSDLVAAYEWAFTE